MFKRDLIIAAIIIFGFFVFVITISFISKFTQKNTSIILTGDIMLGRSVMKVSLQKNNSNYPFEKVSDVLRDADLVFSNLETPIISNCPTFDSGFKFCADPKMIQGLNFASIDILNLANNHSGNYGEDGIRQTQSFLKNSDIDYVGGNNLIIKNINGTKFGFLGFDFVDNLPKDSDYKLVSDYKKSIDVLIVMVHWGNEYTSQPTELQKMIAKSLVDAGADVVVGSHPHWVQDIDYINGKPVFYSLGNFVFDQPWSEETKHGLAVRLIYQKGKLLKIEKLPIYMKNFAQPEWVN